MNKIKAMFRSVQSRYGTYSTLLIVVVMAIVIVANMVAGQFPESWKNIDLSNNDLYEISAQSKDLLRKLEEEVEIHILADKESTDERIRIFLEKYTALSSKVSVKWTDPVLHPSVLTENEAEAQTVLISCKDTGKSRQVTLDEMLYYDQMQYYYYGTYVEIFDVEGQLTSAINYVINEVSSKIYYTTGHGEKTLSDTLNDLMEKSNFTVEELNTMLVDEIPEDCDLLLVYAPASDFSEGEKTLLSAYMQDGGKVIWLLGDLGVETPNADAFLQEYGIQMVNGYVADYERYYPQIKYQQYAVAPVLSLDDELSQGLKTQMIMLLLARGMETTDPTRDTISVETIMSTSENASIITESEETKGTYVLGAVATEEEGKLTVISAYTMLDETVASYSSIENHTLFMNMVSSNFEDVSNISIEAKTLEMAQNTMQHIGLSTVIVIIGIPMLVLIFGFVNWLKRRKA